VTPATGQTGSAVITVKVSDGQNLASTTFNLTVNGIIGHRTFNNASAISIQSYFDNGENTYYSQLGFSNVPVVTPQIADINM